MAARLVAQGVLLGAFVLAAVAAGRTVESRQPVPPPAPVRSTGGAGATGACVRGPVDVRQFTLEDGGFQRWVPPNARGSIEFHEFYFTRAIYRHHATFEPGVRLRRFGTQLGDFGPAWSTDYNGVDRHMMQVARRLSNLDACGWEHPVSLADPELRRYPFLYSEEWGYADLTDREVLGLRGYLEAGGLLMLDDFWGAAEWENFRQNMARVLPGRPIVEIPRTDLIYHTHYTIEGDIRQVPNVDNGRRIGMGYPGAITSEVDGIVPHLRGIYDDRDRLMVVINWNTDLGDALEWAEDPYYPLKYSTFASEIFLNTILYAMTK